MTIIRTLVPVAGDHTITGTAPAALPLGEHEVIVTLPERPRYRVADLPVHPSAWDDRMSQWREDYNDSRLLWNQLPNGRVGAGNGGSEMDAAAFAKWLASIRRLDSTQRERAFRNLAPAEASSPAESSVHKIDQAVAEQSPPPNNEQSRSASAGCPHCGDRDVRPWGNASGKPRYRCVSCQKTFNATTGTPLAHLRYQERWKDQIQALIDGESLAKAAERCNVDYTTAFRWRHRFLAAADLGKTSGLPSISEADWAFILESFEKKRSDKGRRNGLPRKSRQAREN